jgi:hypothetical protein
MAKKLNYKNQINPKNSMYIVQSGEEI